MERSKQNCQQIQQEKVDFNLKGGRSGKTGERSRSAFGLVLMLGLLMTLGIVVIIGLRSLAGG